MLYWIEGNDSSEDDILCKKSRSISTTRLSIEQGVCESATTHAKQTVICRPLVGVDRPWNEGKIDAQLRCTEFHKLLRLTVSVSVNRPLLGFSINQLVEDVSLTGLITKLFDGLTDLIQG